ncbi:MAG: FmdB family zinc ribbon protein [Roseiflexaceae bacterium]
MPTYVYACDTCGAQFEQFQSFKDEPLRTCPTCAGAVRRVFQPVGIVFKGSGWYITDSRKASSATTGSTDSDKSDKPSTGESTAKSESMTKSESTAKSESSSDSKSSASTSSTD